jgi:hypothetical protein
LRGAEGCLATITGGGCPQTTRQATSWPGEGRILVATGREAPQDVKSGKLNFGLSEIISENPKTFQKIRNIFGFSEFFSDFSRFFRIFRN